MALLGSVIPKSQRSRCLLLTGNLIFCVYNLFQQKFVSLQSGKRELIDFHKSLIKRNLSWIALGIVILWPSDTLVSRLCKLITHRLSLPTFGYLLFSLHYVWTYCVIIIELPFKNPRAFTQKSILSGKLDDLTTGLEWGIALTLDRSYILQPAATLITLPVWFL